MLPQTCGKQPARSRTIWNKLLLWPKQHQSLTPGGSNPINLLLLSVRDTDLANIPYPNTQHFHTQGNPKRAAPHMGGDHIPAAVGLGHPRMLSTGMSCQVLQVSWKWLDGCPPCSCTKGCRKTGYVAWWLLRNHTVKDLSLYTS